MATETKWEESNKLGLHQKINSMGIIGMVLVRTWEEKVLYIIFTWCYITGSKREKRLDRGAFFAGQGNSSVEVLCQAFQIYFRYVNIDISNNARSPEGFCGGCITGKRIGFNCWAAAFALWTKPLPFVFSSVACRQIDRHELTTGFGLVQVFCNLW